MSDLPESTLCPSLSLSFTIFISVSLSSSMLKYPSNVCQDGWISQWIKIRRILIHPKFASYTADNKNMMYDVAMIQLAKRIRQPSLTGDARITDVIRPACLPEPGQINQISLVNQCTVGDDVQPGQMAISGQKPS